MKWCLVNATVSAYCLFLEYIELDLEYIELFLEYIELDV